MFEYCIFKVINIAHTLTFIDTHGIHVQGRTNINTNT